MSRAMEQVELHCHCLPGVDDGPQDLAEAVALCRMIEAEGTDTVVATPHMLGPYGRRNSAAAVREAVEIFQQSLEEAGVNLTVLPGGEVRLEEQVFELLEEDRILTLGDRGGALLLELLEVPMNLEGLFESLMGRGVRPVIAHAEMVAWLLRDPRTLQRWQSMGVAVQVNAGSLLGQFGRHASAAGWQLIGSGGAVAVASDAHDAQKRPPRLREAMVQIGMQFGRETAKRLCLDTPRALLGEPVG